MVMPRIGKAPLLDSKEQQRLLSCLYSQISNHAL